MKKQEIIYRVESNNDEYLELKEKYEKLRKNFKKYKERMNEGQDTVRLYMTALADARSDIHSNLGDSPFNAECVVCHDVKPIIGICTTCWDCLRKALELKTAKSKGRENWDVWGYDVSLDLGPLSKMLSRDKEGRELLLKAVYSSKDRKDRDMNEFLEVSK